MISVKRRLSGINMLRIILVCVAFLAVANSNETPQHAPTPTECKSRVKSLYDLDLAVRLIQTARESIPMRERSSWLPTDCEDVLKGGRNASGVYKIWPRNRIIPGHIDVYCDMHTDGGGWTVIQRRWNFLRAADYFSQDWESYKKGFGNVGKDFWLGNDNIFALSNQGLYSARFDLKDIEGSRRFAHYDTFWIDDETRKYKLHVNGYSGDAGDSLAYHDAQMFSTRDADNDNNNVSCSQFHKGGWWFDSCRLSNLNGLYYTGKSDDKSDGITWYSWKGHHESLLGTEIKIRRKV